MAKAVKPKQAAEKAKKHRFRWSDNRDGRATCLECGMHVKTIDDGPEEGGARFLYRRAGGMGWSNAAPLCR